MSTPDATANQRVVERYFEAVRSGSPELPGLFTEDATWWVPESSPLGGLHEGRDAVVALMGQGVDLYDASVPMELETLASVAAGDRVSVQLVLRARTAAGEDYENHYHFAFRLRDGRICEVREYLDTAYARDRLFGGAPA